MGSLERGSSTSVAVIMNGNAHHVLCDETVNAIQLLALDAGRSARRKPTNT